MEGGLRNQTSSVFLTMMLPFAFLCVSK